MDGLVKKLDGCDRVLDLGAGTGNGTLALLRAQKDREVWSVEFIHIMLQQLIAKIEQAQVTDRCDYFGRLRPIKEDLVRLNDLPEGEFDGAMLLNVLYAIDDPEGCLRNVGRWLRPGGKAVFSTSHKDTDVDRLFARMKQVLERKGLFDQLESNFDDAHQRHLQMDQLIHRDTQEDIRRWVEKGGFEILEWNESRYADSVIVVTAVKR